MTVAPQVIAQPTFTVCWTPKDKGKEFDVDAALVMYNVGGQLLQVCFDQVSFPGVVHSGDSAAGKESLSIDFSKIPLNVQYIVFVITVPTSKSGKSEPIAEIFDDITVDCRQIGYRISLLKILAQSPASHNFVPLLCVRRANTPVFQLHLMDALDASEEGKVGGLENVWRLAEHVVHQCVDPNLWNEFPHSHTEVLRLKKKEKVYLPTSVSKSSSKGLIATLPQAGTFSPLRTIGLRWTPSVAPGQKFDLDLHVWLLDIDTKQVVSHCFYGNKTSSDGSIKLSGDDLTGDGDESEDDEQMSIDLVKVDRRIDAIFVGVQIFTGQTFGQVSNESCRAIDANGQEMARFSLDKDKKLENSSAVVMCVLRRDSTHGKGGWLMSAVGEAVTRSDLRDENAYKTLVEFY